MLWLHGTTVAKKKVSVELRKNSPVPLVRPCSEAAGARHQMKRIRMNGSLYADRIIYDHYN